MSQVSFNIESPERIRTKLVEHMVELLWDAWIALGVSGSTKPKVFKTPLDPEILLLLTASFGRYDARLFDEVLDWMLRHANLIQISRVKTLAKTFPFSGGPVALAMADCVSRQQGGPKWKIEKKKGGDAQPLFHSSKHFGSVDECFAEHGWLRSPVVLRNLSQQFPVNGKSSQMLELRALFGVSSRADCLLYFKANPSRLRKWHPSGLAKILGYSQQSIQKTLVEMSLSGLIERLPEEEGKVFYRITPDLYTFIEGTGSFTPWVRPVAFLDEFLSTLELLIDRSVSAKISGSEVARWCDRFSRSFPEYRMQSFFEYEKIFDLIDDLLDEA
jgi:hypothetical protein